jgi:predicted secreted protein
VRRLGVVLAFAPLGHVSGLYLREAGSPGILLHSGHPRTRQRYTAGHELGHHVFGHALELDLDIEESLRREGGRWPDHEKEAEAFGAWFLMPRRLMRAGLAELGIGKPRDPLDVYALSLWLGTSYTATARQLGTVRIVDAGDAERWAGVAPKTIKQALAGEMAPDDLRNDVWWLDARHHHQPLEVRPGDRIVLTLEENASTGYSWRFAEQPPVLSVLADSYEDQWEPQLRLSELDGHDELVGAPHPRSFVVEVAPDAGAAAWPVVLMKDRPWQDDSRTDEFELLVSVNPPLHGVQIPESEFALTR